MEIVSRVLHTSRTQDGVCCYIQDDLNLASFSSSGGIITVEKQKIDASKTLPMGIK